MARCYSLCSSPFTDDALTVTVKRTADGYASNWLCDHAHPGMRIHVLAPSGTFVPKTLDDDFLLVAAGSGITPMMAICKSALSQGSGQVVLIYANRDESSVIFGSALRELAAKYPDRLTVVHWLESVQGLPSAAGAGHPGRPVHRPPGVHLRPRPVHGGRPGGARVVEGAGRAGAHRGVPVAGVRSVRGRGHRGRWRRAAGHRGRHPRRATHEVRWPRNAKLLDVLLDKGLDAPFSCREGHCGACAVPEAQRRGRDGDQRRARATGPRRRLILGCQARPKSDSVEVTYDE